MRSGRFMKCFRIFPLLMAAFLVLPQFLSAQYKSQEVSEADGIPVLVKHLPDWESVKDQARITDSLADVRAWLGQRPVLDAIDLSGGAEAATAMYPAGKLLLLEYPTPQMSSAADAVIIDKLTNEPSSPPILYKRIGNYNVLVFDAADSTAAEALIAKIKYEKSVQWLGDDPFLVGKIERYLVGTSADMLISTAIFITLGLATAVVIGIFGGFVVYRMREQRRTEWHAFSDAGGLTRLNLDELSE